MSVRRDLLTALLSMTCLLAACSAPDSPVPEAESTAAEPPADTLPRGPTGRPRLDGIWQSLSGAGWDVRAHAAGPGAVDDLGALGAVPPGLGVVDGGDIPYQEWAVARQRENYANRLSLDPEVKCYLPGVPRATYMDHPFQIFQTRDYVMLIYQYASAVRTVHMNDPGPPPAASWMGWSVGRWEGDTLVVDVTGLNDETWFDRAGNFHSDALHVVERYSLIDRDHLLYEAEIDDPEVFTRSWTIRLPLYRRIEENAQLMEFKCVPFSEEVLYGDLRKQPDE
jgi:hypothetical protein